MKWRAGRVARITVAVTAAIVSSPHIRAGQATGPVDAMSLLQSFEAAWRGQVGPLQERPDLPGDFPRDVLPKGTIVKAVGGAGSMTLVVSAPQAGTAFDPSRFEWGLEDAGWIEEFSPARGFVDASAANPTIFCRGTDFLSLAYRRQSAPGWLVDEGVGKWPDSTCTPPGARLLAGVPVPRLLVPAEMKGGKPSTSGSGDSLTSRVRIETAATLDELASRFTPQMAESGWTPSGNPVRDDLTVTARYSAQTRSGEPAAAMLRLQRIPTLPVIDATLAVVRGRTAPAEWARIDPIATLPIAPTDVVLHFTRPIDPGRLFISSLLRHIPKSPRAQIREGFRTVGAQDVVVDTVLNGHPAAGARILVACDGFQLAVADVPFVADAASRRVTIDPAPLASVPLTGRVEFPPGRDPGQFTIEATMEASWLVIGPLLDEAVPGGNGPIFLSDATIARAGLAADGSFTLNLPNLADDPGTALWPSIRLSFRARSKYFRYPMTFGLVSASPAPSDGRGIPVARAYPRVLVLRPKG
jgi:hypothetical protein